MSLEDSPEEPHYRSELSILSPASPKPIHFPAPTNIPVLNNMMDVDYNQTELHMQDPAMRDTAVRDGAWQETGLEDDKKAEDVEDRAEDAALEGTAVAVAASTGNQSAEQVESAVGPNVTTVDAPNVMNSATNHVEDPSQQDQAQPSNVNTQITQPNHDIHPDATETAQPAQNDIAPDADAFLKQIQTTMPSNGTDAMFDVTRPDHAGHPPVDSMPTAFTGQGNTNASDTQQAYPVQTNTSTHVPEPQQQPGEHNEQQSQAYPVTPATAQSIELGSNNFANVTTLQSLFPSGTLPADLAASLMQATGQPHTASHPLPAQPAKSVTPLESRRERKIAAGEALTSDDERWTAEIQQKYDEFIQDERRYVNEGRWDSFPHGSRLFVGNLSSESVTKRDIFHVFHSYGRLAQISIKQAFGFVQFLNADDCAKALEGEQGRQIKDKKIHLEISKPQKPRNQGNARDRRSRSPESRNAARPGVDRYSGGSSRGERDGHRASYRSPSPRRGYRDRYDDRFRERSRTPPGFSRNRRYGRSPSPPGRDPDDDLPLPKRAAQDIPEVQIIVVDNLDREFVGWVEKAFAARGIRVAVLLLNPRLDEQAVTKRQIIEGVLAVTKLTRTSQNTGKIDLQIFDRRGGQSNVRFEEYSSLDPQTCAELVLRARSTHAAPAPVQYGYSSTPSHMPPAPQPQYGYAPPSTAPQYDATPPFLPPQASAPQYAYQPASGYNTMKPVQQGSAPPNLVPMSIPGYGPPPVVQPVSYPPNPSAMPSNMQQQPGLPQAGQVDMQQILARLGNYNK